MRSPFCAPIDRQPGESRASAIAKARKERLSDCACSQCKIFKQTYNNLLQLTIIHERYLPVGRTVEDASAQVYDAWVAFQQHWTHKAAIAEHEGDEWATEEEDDARSEISDERSDGDWAMSEDGHEESEEHEMSWADMGKIHDLGHYSTKDGLDKFIVCDHCMAHGLKCNEASVCDQCKLYEQACVHRWCRQSPDSKDDCLLDRCRYAHKDGLPHEENEPDWILLPGRLPIYLSRGKLPSRHDPSGGWHLSSLHEEVHQRQKEGLEELEAAVKDGRGSLKSLHLTCDCRPESEEEEEQPTVDVDGVLCRTCGREEPTNTALYACAHRVCLRCTAFRFHFEKDTACPKCHIPDDHVWQCSLRLYDGRIAKRKGKELSELFTEVQTSTGTLMIHNFETAETGRWIGFYCPRGCDGDFGSWERLAEHALMEHDKLFCQACVNKKVLFPSEEKLYSMPELYRHAEEVHGGHTDDHLSFVEWRSLYKDGE